jgi:SSS family solute:Na+ symporter
MWFPMGLMPLLADGGPPALPIDPAAVRLLACVLLGYFVVLVAASGYGAGKVRNEANYLVAGRRLPLAIVAGTLVATWFDAATLFAASEAARDRGLLGVVLNPFACAGALVLVGVFFARPLWRMQLSTMADFWQVTYGPAAEVVGACIQVPAYFPWVALQYVALANVFELYFGLPQTVGILIVAAVTLVCTLGGGLWSVTLTDTIQIVIGLGGLVVLTAAALADPRLGDGDPLRGLVMVFTTVAAKHPDHLRLVPSDASPTVLLGWLAAWATGLFGNVPVQDLQQRVFAARSGTAAMLGCILAGVAYLAFAMLPVTLGLASLVTHPEGQLDPVGYLAGQYLSTGMLVVFVVSVASIVVSTATSAVLAPAAILGLARGLHDRTSRRRDPQRPLHGRHHRAVRDVGARLRYGWLRAGHRRLPAGQCVAVFENRLSTTTPATISPMPTIAAESSFSP